jgi:hypothetical protein
MTVGWIFEGNLERFLAASERVPEQKPAAPSFQCPFCKNSFQARDQLSSHVQTVHTIKRPFILVAGNEPGGDDILRAMVAPKSFEVFNCTALSAGLDGAPLQSVSRDTLCRQLSGLRRATIRIQLVNSGDGLVQPVIQEYRLRVVAPDDASLAQVDKLFISTFGSEDVHLEKVGSFYEVTRDNTASEYAEALADYIRAALIKDGDTHTGISNRLYNYREIQNRALTVLQSFERPIARLVCSLLRFGLNDFSHWQQPSGFARLDEANAILGPLAFNIQARSQEVLGEKEKDQSIRFVCPVDVGTDTVTRLAKQAVQLSRWGLAAEEQFIGIAGQATVDNLDRAKIRALWAITALRLGATDSAERALRLLDGDPTFGIWASHKLTRAES